MIKKISSIAILLALLLCSLTSCFHEHTWNTADCTHPRTCAECGETEGNALGHTWTEATCTKPQTCSICSAVGDAPLGHTSVTLEEVIPTCTTKGKTSGTKCEVCSEILSGCVEIAKNPHSTRFGICSECDQLITELLPEANRLLDVIKIADNAIAQANDVLNYALDLSYSRMPDALNTAFSYVNPAADALIDAYAIVDSYDEFSNLKSDIETMYAVVLYIQDLEATSSNVISVSYNFVDAATLYWETKEAFLLKLAAYMS